MATSDFLTLVFLFLSFSSLAFAERCHPNDKKTLLKIKKDLNNAYDFVSWDPKIDCCEWNNVKCDEKTNCITSVAISNSDLKLPLLASIGDLPFLQSLSFYKTNLTGQIPIAITKLTKLKFLDLRWNMLTGSVPSFFSQLKNLNYIGLSFNNLTGSIPPSLSRLPKLGGLLLDRNKLTGSIPESFADFRVKEFYLYLSHNQLNGTIPRRLGNTNFNLFDVSRNRLEGDISFLFGKNKSINTAYFSRNMLQFDMSRMEFPKTLGNLDLSHNMIYGSLPEGLTKINYINLNVSYNKLCGRIPVGGNLQKLDYTAYFHNRCLCGAPLPDCK
ncbi:Polygalacturonase inhibitor 2 [Sesamum alatum]|uniref:Polygalacturonase inhibitor 2 n=1 Tax=Sesamum alatum TaxID=300844 RepID=A0AAE1XNB7_9LAMI|nr:Polygalacturonase inhibitor 2 [Sesamum alatum]